LRLDTGDQSGHGNRIEWWTDYCVGWHVGRVTLDAAIMITNAAC